MLSLRNAVDLLQIGFIAYIYRLHRSLEKKQNLYDYLIVRCDVQEKKFVELITLAVNSNGYVKSINTKMEKLILDMDGYLLKQDATDQLLKE